MCCGRASWKRVAVFCLTFGLGIFGAGLLNLINPFQSKPEWCPINERHFQPSDTKPAAIPAENKNCVPVDKNLKYEQLAENGKTAPVALKADPNLKSKKQEDKKNSLKAESENDSADPQYYNPSKDSAELSELLHKERCFETQAQ